MFSFLLKRIASIREGVESRDLSTHKWNTFCSLIKGIISMREGVVSMNLSIVTASE